MLEGLHSAAAGMAAQQQRLDAVANDLANANTTGYKHQRVGFRDLVYDQTGRSSAQGVRTGSGAAAVDAGRAFAQGTLQRTDRTLDVALQFPCRVVKHVANSGKGAAMRTGIALASGENVVFIDADATYPADLIPDIVCQLGNGYGHVRCTRREGRVQIPALNRVGNFFLDLGIAAFSGLPGNDFLTGAAFETKHVDIAALVDSPVYDFRKLD